MTKCDLGDCYHNALWFSDDGLKLCKNHYNYLRFIGNETKIINAAINHESLMRVNKGSRRARKFI